MLYTKATAKKKIKSLGFTQLQLAEYLGLNKDYINKVLNGRNKKAYTEEIQKKISDFINTKIEEQKKFKEFCKTEKK